MDIEKYKIHEKIKKLRTKSEANVQNNKTSVFLKKQTLTGSLRFQ